MSFRFSVAFRNIEKVSKKGGYSGGSSFTGAGGKNEEHVLGFSSF